MRAPLTAGSRETLHLPDKRAGESSREYAARTLLWNIVHLRLEPGTRISENDMAGVLSMSRTPVREAFISLEKAGIVDILPQRGTYVSLIDMAIVQEARFARSVLEAALWREACERLAEADLLSLEEILRMQDLLVEKADWDRYFLEDNAFHALIFERCGKARIHRSLEPLMCHLDRVRSLSTRCVDLRPKIDEHRRLVHAIRRGDGDAAERLARSHSAWILEDQAVLRREHPRYFAG